MHITEKLNNFSEEYRKYIMIFKISEGNCYTITGDDLSKKVNDNILVNKDNKIIMSTNFNHIIKYIRENKVFDELKFTTWLRKIIPLYKQLPKYKYAKYDFDILVKYFILNVNHTLNKLQKRNCNDFINFINLVDSYAEQTGNKILLKLRNDKNIDLLWQYFYDLFVWKLQLSQSQKKNALKDFDIELFRVTFSKIYSLFLSNIRII